MSDPFVHTQVADLIYNGVTIHNCQTEQFVQETLYDQTGTDQIGNHYRIAVVGYIFPKYDASAFNILGMYGSSNYSVPSSASGDQVAALKAIRAALLAPRGNLKFTVAGTPLLETTPEPASLGLEGGYLNDYAKLDIKNGPHPIACNITKLIGAGLFRVRYEIETWTDGCKDAVVLSNRWSLIESADGSEYITRSIQGRVRFRSAIGDSANDPNGNALTRGLVFPGLAETFTRTSIQTNRSADGLELDYNVVDRQIYAAAPAPAHEWNCIHREVSEHEGMSAINIEISMKGPPGFKDETIKAKMFSAAISIIEAKVGVVSNPDGRQLNLAMIHHIELIDFLHDSQIQVNFLAQRLNNWLTEEGAPGLQGIVTGGGLIKSPLGSRLNAGDQDEMQGTGGIAQGQKYNPYRSVPVPNYPSGSAAAAFICFLQTPCSNHALNDLKPATPSPYTPPPDYTKAIEKGTQLAQSGGTLTSNPTSNRLWDSSTTPDYASYKIDVAYHTQNFTVHMPVSLDQSAGSSQATSVIGTLAPPLTKRQVIIEGKRKKGRPVLLKHVKYTDPDVGVCVPWGQAIIKQMVPTISVDGNFYEYSVQAEYWWACEKAFTGTAIGTALPWDAGAAQDDNHKVKLSDSDDARFTTPGTGGVA